MNTDFSANLWKILACPYCMTDLEKTSQGAICSHCGEQYNYTDSGSLDLRLRSPKVVSTEFEVGSTINIQESLDFKPLREYPAPQVDFSGLHVPHHLTKERLSYFPRALSKDSLMLDLGCGGAIHREVCERSGFEYVGLDYDEPNAPILGDAHALPFKDNSFEFILSVAVLEHIRYPFVMIREAHRVLKPNGKLIGTVAFLEPFHLDSYYHHSHLGTLNLLKFGGFSIQQIAPHENYTVLISQLKMGLFPGMPRSLSKTLVLPLEMIHQLWWWLRYIKARGKKYNLNDRIRNTNGAFTFIATKEA